MCLYKITKQIAPTDEVVEAYKIAAYDARGLKTWIYDIKREKGCNRIYPHHWYKARRTYIYLYSGGGYTTGFHCFSKLAHAKKALQALQERESMYTDKYTLVRVLAKRVHTYGKEYHGSLVPGGTMLANVLVAEWVQYKEEVK